MTDPEFGDTWVYESIVGSLPGVSISGRAAVAIQFLAFEAAVLGVGAYYGLVRAAVAGTAAVAVAAAGSLVMIHIGGTVRAAGAPEPYRRLLFSKVEVVLAVLAFVALVTYLFAFDAPGDPLVDVLFGPDPPVLVVYLTLLVLWDLCYRIGTGWWASVAALYRSARYRFDPATARRLRRADLATMGFGLVQLALVPFLLEYRVLLAALLGHVVAVTAVTGLSAVLLGARRAE